MSSFLGIEVIEMSEYGLRNLFLDLCHSLPGAAPNKILSKVTYEPWNIFILKDISETNF